VSRQLPLRFEHRALMTDADFLVADCNADAVAWLDRWPDWSAPALVVHGPPGCGKTHLAHVWAARAGAIHLPAATIGGDPSAILADRTACVIERPDHGVDEVALFHLYNTLVERRGSMLITAESPPSRWPIALPDLRSRLTAAAAVAVGLPDDELLGAVIVKLFADRQIQLDQDVLSWLLKRLERSFAAARRAVTAIDEAALAERRRITIPFVRDVLRAHGAAPD
jgi:DnaA regulatory inactivator Hda